jgi:uncharacterized protein YecT (DUF1311 family)
VIAFLLALADSTPRFVCNRGGSEHELRICAEEDYAAADRKLNVQWPRTLSAVKKEAARFPEIRAMWGLARPDESLIKAQRAWMIFREQSCRTEERISAGSVHTRRYFQCMQRMTKDRTRKLYELSSNPEHPEDPL